MHSNDSPPALGAGEKHLTEAGTQVESTTCDGRVDLRDMLGNQHHSNSVYNWCATNAPGENSRAVFVLNDVNGQPTPVYSKLNHAGHDCWYQFRYATEHAR